MSWRHPDDKPKRKPFYTTPDRVIRVLQGARDLVSKPGAWWRGSYQSEQGHLCLEAAIRDCCEGDKFLAIDAMRVMRDVLGIRHVHSDGTEIVGRGRQPNPVRSLFDWNDAPGRTQEQVIAALEAGIASAEWIMTPGEVFA